MADKDHVLTFSRCLHRVFSRKIDLSGSSTRPGGKAIANFLGSLFSLGVEDWSEEVTKIIGWNPENGFFLLDEALLDHIKSNIDGSEASALSVASLKHPQFSFLNGELNVLHIAEVLLKLLTGYEEFFMRFRKIFGHLGDGLRSTHTGNDVLSLCINEILTIEHIFAGSGITSERNAGSRALTCVTKDHGLDVDSGSPGSGNSILLAVNDRSIVLPGIEYGVHGSLELLTWIFGEILT